MSDETKVQQKGFGMWSILCIALTLIFVFQSLKGSQ